MFRVDLSTGAVQPVDLGGASVTNGDGFELIGRTLYVVRNAVGLIAEVRLSGDSTRGTLVGTSGDASLRFPTTAAFSQGRLLVVNSQFNQRGGTPEVPFTVSSIRKP